MARWPRLADRAGLAEDGVLQGVAGWLRPCQLRRADVPLVFVHLTCFVRAEGAQSLQRCFSHRVDLQHAWSRIHFRS